MMPLVIVDGPWGWSCLITAAGQLVGFYEPKLEHVNCRCSLLLYDEVLP